MINRDGSPIILMREICIIAAVLVAYMTVDYWADYVVHFFFG